MIAPVIRVQHVDLSCSGVIAQLGERLHGMQEVRGSIPRSSTTTNSRRMAPIGIIRQQHLCGVIAQLGERLHGMQEVRGSIPRSSTTFQSTVDDGCTSDLGL
jgi:hypothetical protein